MIRAVVASAALVLVAGCGESGGTPQAGTDSPSGSGSTSSGSSSPADPSSSPQCASIWTKGGMIPDPYKGCYEDTTLVPAAKHMCESGQTLVTYADRYYGVVGNVVNDVGSPLAASAQYRRARRSCG